VKSITKEINSRELAEYVTEPNVTVVVIQMNSRFVSVIGEVGQDTRVPLTRGTCASSKRSRAAGGFGPFADKSDVRIVRRNGDGTESEYRFDYDAYIRGRAPGTDIVLQHGDTIVVPRLRPPMKRAILTTLLVSAGIAGAGRQSRVLGRRRSRVRRQRVPGPSRTRKTTSCSGCGPGCASTRITATT